MAYTNQTPGDRLKEITDQLEKGLQDLFSSEKYAAYLKVMSKFYGYSASNTLFDLYAAAGRLPRGGL